MADTLIPVGKQVTSTEDEFTFIANITRVANHSKIADGYVLRATLKDDKGQEVFYDIFARKFAFGIGGIKAFSHLLLQNNYNLKCRFIGVKKGDSTHVNHIQPIVNLRPMDEDDSI